MFDKLMFDNGSVDGCYIYVDKQFYKQLKGQSIICFCFGYNDRQHYLAITREMMYRKLEASGQKRLADKKMIELCL